ncbi:1-phosphofructokinase family hexose kinase [Isoptericola sp. NPDC057653]|uniref:1-phosphofructokinase family hexose kinase n=1 Tax=Isoptericola sp. NPDC057653 TaxID=3346195 RepID=UPI003679D4DC
MTRVVAVTPNPAWDVTYRVDRLVPGESLRVRTATARAGGKGVNVARVARALGHPSLAVSTAGGPLGAAFRDDLAAAGQDALLVPVAGPTRQSVTVVPAAPDGAHPTVLNEPGAALSGAEWAAMLDAVARTAGPGDVVTVSGSLPPGTTQDRFAGLVTAALGTGARVVVDTSGPALRWAAEAGAHLLKPNRAELADAAGLDDPAEAVALLQGLGAGEVVVTDGASGMTAYAPGGGRPRVVARARLTGPPLAGNPTGAGDAATAALAVGLAGPTEPSADRLALAVAVSAAAVLRPVAGDVDPADVAALRARVAVT